MVEVFKTSIEHEKEASIVKAILGEYLGYSNITFDLEDCDRILRVKASKIDPKMIINLSQGF